MFSRNNKTVSELAPEKVHYTKYYEHDGQLRAYANRSMLMAGLFGLIAFVSLLFAIYVRLQPPTVIRVAADGEATVVGGRSAGGSVTAGLLKVLAAAQAGEVAPTDIEGRAAVRKFLESYLRYTPTSVDKNFADALNMMTAEFANLLPESTSGPGPDRKDQGRTDHVFIQDPIHRASTRSAMDVSGLRREGGPPNSQQERVHRQNSRQIPCAADSGPPLRASAQRASRG